MRVFTPTLLAITFLAGSQQTPKESPAPSKQVQAEMSGCVDQRKEEFVLTSPVDMTVLARLKGKGFANENFARYVGQKVNIRGYATGGVFEVVKIMKLADTCSR